MKDDFENVYDMLEHAIEYAFVGKMQLKFKRGEGGLLIGLICFFDLYYIEK